MDKSDIENIVVALLALPVLYRRQDPPNALGARGVFEEIRRELRDGKITGQHERPPRA